MLFQVTQDSSLQDRLVKWKARSDVERDDYVKFFILYMIFNAWLSAEAQQSGNRANGDRGKLEWLKESNSELESYWSNYDLDFELSDELLKLRFVRNMRTDAEDNCFDQTIDLNNFAKVLEFVYTIRCNLFHGDKPYLLGERNHRLVKSGSRILNIWVEYILVNIR